ncbi:MAG: PQQ-binding-like beta-propeller repeat protein [Verrucomicrobiota bacterium]
MKTPPLALVFITTAFTSVCLLAASNAEDWPQWLGPNRDATWNETGILKKFPDGGPKVLWRTPVSWGYSGPAVADGKVFLMDYVIESGEIENNPGARDILQGKERVRCFDTATGKEIWSHSYDRPYAVSYGGGPRCTTTVADGKVFALGAEGNLWCLDQSDGSVIWSHDLPKVYNTETAIWGYAAHPLVHNDLVYCIVGGDGSVAVAFDKETGEERWRALSAPEPGYCPPTLITHADVDQLIIWDPKNINSLNPETGETYWSLPLQPSYAMSIMAPRQEGNILFASGIGRVGAAIQLDDTKPAASFLWRANPKQGVFAANSTPYLLNGMIYGPDIDTSALIGAKLSDGTRLWETTVPVIAQDLRSRVRHGTAMLTYHPETDQFFIFNEIGDLIIAKLTPDGYEEVDRFHAVDATNNAFDRPVVWTTPAYAEKSAFIRNDKELIRVDLSAE